MDGQLNLYALVSIHYLSILYPDDNYTEVFFNFVIFSFFLSFFFLFFAEAGSYEVFCGSMAVFEKINTNALKYVFFFCL